MEMGEDEFKKSFKYYKRRKPPPEFNDVLEVNSSFQDGEQIVPCPLTSGEEEEAKALGLISYNNWKIFNFNSHPDLLFIRNPFSSEGQLKWIQMCLMDFPCLPNKTNLESHDITVSESSWWEQASSAEGKSKDLMKKLRWVTLGYHHNWDTKEYSEEMRGVMPVNLKNLCALVAKVLGFQDYRAEAAIINFYHEDSSLGPHTDHSEPNMNAPLFSFSFGQSAVFLIGNSTKDVKPTALFLHSGDILIMAKSSRLSYHAVPRILLVEDTPWNSEDHCKHDISGGNHTNNSASISAEKHPQFDIRNILKYAKTNRINMNVRQVLLPSMQNLPP